MLLRQQRVRRQLLVSEVPEAQVETRVMEETDPSLGRELVLEAPVELLQLRVLVASRMLVDLGDGYRPGQFITHLLREASRLLVVPEVTRELRVLVVTPVLVVAVQISEVLEVRAPLEVLVVLRMLVDSLETIQELLRVEVMPRAQCRRQGVRQVMARLVVLAELRLQHLLLRLHLVRPQPVVLVVRERSLMPEVLSRRITSRELFPVKNHLCMRLAQ